MKRGQGKSIKQNKSAQVTIFIIIALIIIVSIIFVVTLMKKVTVSIVTTNSPQEYMEKCMKDAIENVSRILLNQGGSVSPTNYKLYNNFKVDYLCYNTNYYYPCVMQQPMFIAHIRNEIIKAIKPRVDSCFQALKKDLEKEYTVTLSNSENITCDMSTGKIKVNVERELTVSRGSGEKYNTFKVNFPSPLYDLAVIAQEIASQEAKFCYFSYDGFMILYPDFKIEKFQTSDGSKIYTISKRASNRNKLNTAIRSCAMPAGF